MAFRYVILSLVGLLCAAGLTVWFVRDVGTTIDRGERAPADLDEPLFHSQSTADSPSEAILQEPTPEYESSYRNTRDAHRVGQGRCVECHGAEAAAFASTPHAHSLERVRLDDEPPDAEFAHAASGQTYQVAREDGAMWHRERFVDVDGNEIAVKGHPIAWRIGSGHHSRSYLIDVDGYLFESPITWYASQSAWGMSPGFDVAHHEGFSRAASDGCVECHSGQIESIGKSTHHLNILEASIGCENCHGPGSLHVDERTAALPVGTDFDETIVNPRKLSRELNESICARCHLRGAGWALVRGRDLSEFKPGLPLSDYRVDFVKERSSGSMEVVGHFEQMHASRCYTQTDSLTCTTCHNPHQSPMPAEKVGYYRDKCLQCHDRQSAGCAVPEQERRRQNADDDCAHCHMPKSDTDIPHFTFTHHRIGIDHAKPQESQESQGETLVPFGDVSRLSTVDLQRCLGVALARPSSHLGQNSLQRVLRHLANVYEQGLRDPQLLGSLAYVLWNLNDPACLQLAEQSLASPDCAGETRISSLIVLGDTHLNRGAFAQAEAAFDELTQLRPRSTDWQMLGVCRSLQNNSPGAIEAFHQALDLQPGSADLHSLLADELTKAGQLEAARQHRELASRLQNAQPRPTEPR